MLNRITFVDRRTICITGKVIPHGPDRQGHPQKSQYEARKKSKLKRPRGRNWAEEFEKTHLTKEDVEVCCATFSENLKDAEVQMKAVRKDLAAKNRTRTEASQNFVADKRAAFAATAAGISTATADTSTATVPGIAAFDTITEATAASFVQCKARYVALQCARQVVREARTFTMPKEEELRRLRYESYFWNNVLTAAKSNEKKKSTARPVIPPNRTEATWTNHTIEEATEFLDVSKLINSDQGQIVFAGTDYGICKMSVTVPQTVHEIQVHLNRYAALQCGMLNDNENCLEKNQGVRTLC